MYIIKCWIPVEEDLPFSLDDQTYTTFEEARIDLEELELMQPENIYMIEEI